MTRKNDEVPNKFVEVEVPKMQAVLKEAASMGKKYDSTPVKKDGKIIAWDFDCEDGTILRVSPTMFPWIPHERNTWPCRYMTTKVPISYRNYGKADDETKLISIPVGTRVKIVMASRFGDVGITRDLLTETNYFLRIDISELPKKFDNFSMKP